MVEREYLTTERPLVDQAAERILKLQESSDILDLGETICIVPTQHAARRLRESLATQAAIDNRAICPPSIYTPNSFLRILIPESHDSANASEAFSHWAMFEAIKNLNQPAADILFPGVQNGRNDASFEEFGWGMSVVPPIMNMRRALSDNAFTIQKVADLPKSELTEPARWNALAVLEKLYMKILASHGFRDEIHSISELLDLNRIDALDQERLMLLGVPNLSPILKKVLSQIKKQSHLNIEVWIYSDPDYCDDFDEWGCPIYKSWYQRPITMGVNNISYNRSLEPSQMIDSVESWYVKNDRVTSEVALGVLDSSILDPLESKLGNSNHTTFNPAGKPLRFFETYQLLEAFVKFVKKSEIYEAIELGRHFEIFNASDPNVSHREFLSFLDRLRADHLVTSIDGIELWVDRIHTHFNDEIENRNKAALLEFFNKLQEWKDQVSHEKWCDGIIHFLEDIYGDRELDTRKEEDRFFTVVSNEIIECLEEIQKIPKIKPWHGLDLFLLMIGKKLIYHDREGGEVDLLGWMELLWEPAQSIALVGLQDNIVPETISGDAFLPEKFRAQLGLPTNEDRMARDVYTMHSLAAQRSEDGSIDVFFCDKDATGNPQRPSRLCFLCHDRDLPSRVIELMGESNIVVAERAPVFQNSWKLRVPTYQSLNVGHPKRMSVTSFSSYLRCPFRFYLEHILKMAPVDRGKMELDPREFGNLFHKVLENFGNDPEARLWVDEKKIRQFFKSNLEKLIHGIYGADLPAALWIQYESLLQRLNAVAGVEAENRSCGWQIQGVEIRVHNHFPENLNKVWQIDGIELAGTIDRIERNEKTGEIRLVDFKTSNNAKAIFDAHAQKCNESNEWHATRETWQTFDWEKKMRGKNQVVKHMWVNLQLPLYAKAWTQLYPDHPFPGVAYFNAPKTVHETGLSVWEGFSPDLVEHAFQCAISVIRGIKAGIFYPPNPEPEFETFPEFFIQDPSRIVEWDNDDGQPWTGKI